MRFEKSPAWLIELFDQLLAETRANRRQMFGYPAGFANGQLCCGLFEESLFVRLGEEERNRLLATPGATLFDPMGGRPMREYVVVPPEMLEDEEALQGWMGRAVVFAESLPPKGLGRPKKAPTQTKVPQAKKKTGAPPAALRSPKTRSRAKTTPRQ